MQRKCFLGREFQDGIHFVFETNFKYKSCGRFHCLATISRQNEISRNGLDATALNVDRVHLRKMAAILETVGYCSVSTVTQAILTLLVGQTCVTYTCLRGLQQSFKKILLRFHSVSFTISFVDEISFSLILLHSNK